jgi:hypothetical protein
MDTDGEFGMNSIPKMFGVFGGGAAAVPASLIVPVLTSNTGTNGVAIRSSVFADNPVYEAWRAFNGSIVSAGGGNGFWNAAVGMPAYIGYQFSAAKTVTSYKLNQGDGGIVAYYPNNFTFDGSNNGTDWTTLDTRTGEASGKAASTWYTYTITSPASYTYYRLNITAAFQNYGVIQELEMWGY